MQVLNFLTRGMESKTAGEVLENLPEGFQREHIVEYLDALTADVAKYFLGIEVTDEEIQTRAQIAETWSNRARDAQA